MSMVRIYVMWIVLIGGHLSPQKEYQIPQQTDLELPSLPAGDSIYDYNVNPETGR